MIGEMRPSEDVLRCRLTRWLEVILLNYDPLADRLQNKQDAAKGLATSVPENYRLFVPLVVGVRGTHHFAVHLGHWEKKRLVARIPTNCLLQGAVSGRQNKLTWNERTVVWKRAEVDEIQNGSRIYQKDRQNAE